MTNSTENSTSAVLDSLTLHVFSHADSLEEARQDAFKSIMENPTKHNISLAIDYYHNTLIETVREGVNRI